LTEVTQFSGERMGNKKKLLTHVGELFLNAKILYLSIVFYPINTS